MILRVELYWYHVDVVWSVWPGGSSEHLLLRLWVQCSRIVPWLARYMIVLCLIEQTSCVPYLHHLCLGLRDQVVCLIVSHDVAVCLLIQILNCPSCNPLDEM